MADKVENALTTTAGDIAQGIGENILQNAVGSFSPFNAPYLSGGRAVIKINNKVFAFAFAVNYTINTDYTENWTIDDWTPYELMPNRISVNGTMSAFHVPGNSATKLLIQPNVLSFLFHRYITLEITDRMTGNIVFKTNRAVITSKTQTIQAGELSTLQLSWKAVGWIDEMTPAFPEGFDSEQSADLSPLSGLTSGLSGAGDLDLDDLFGP